jgi:NADPH:quinone reductase-like Zn-dependent oxidoreductase
VAKHLGANVIGTVSTEAKARSARTSGADHVVLYTEQDFVAETKRITNGWGADLIIDDVGRTTFKGDLEAAATRGHIVIFGRSQWSCRSSFAEFLHAERADGFRRKSTELSAHTRGADAARI